MVAEKQEKTRKLSLSDAVERIIRGDDPGVVKDLLGVVDDPVYKEFLGLQRNIIDKKTDEIVDALCDRISAAKKVAVLCFLAEKPIHKPARENQLILWAKKRCKKNCSKYKIECNTIEDIVRYILIKARIEQDVTIGDIAKKISEKGLFLSSQISSGRGTDFSIQPISTSMNDSEQILIREESNIKEFGIAGLTKKYTKNYRTFKKNFLWLNPLIEKEAIIGHRDYDVFIKEFENKEKSVVLSFLPAKEMNVGFIRTTEFLKIHQNLGLKIKLSFNNTETKERQKEILFNHLLNLAAFGLDIDEKKLEVYIQSNQKDVLNLAVKISGEIPLSTVNSALGLSMSESLKSVFNTFIAVADILGNEICSEGDKEGNKEGNKEGKNNVLVVSELNHDLYVRFARHVSSDIGLSKPSSIYLRSIKPLSLNGTENDFIYFSDSEEQIKNKIKHAITGGKESLEQQKKFGGNPDTRICAVSSLFSFVLSEDEHKKITEKCIRGETMCGECKENCIYFFVNYIKRHNEKKEKLRDKVSDVLNKINL